MMADNYQEGVDEVVEDDVYVGSEGDIEGDDQVVSDELVDDDADTEVDVVTGTDDVHKENGDDEVKDQEQEQADADADAGTKTSHKRSHSKSPPASHEKDDFKDDELDSDVDETAEKAADETDPEDEEYEMLNMPSVRSVMSEVGHLKQERRVMVHSLSLSEFSDATMQSLWSCESCEEVKVHFVRPKGKPQDWSGFVVMNFMSSRAAKQAADEMKTIREDLTVDTVDGTAFPRSIVDSWAKEEKGQKRWTDTLLYVKNIGENVTEDDLKQVFTECEDIVLRKAESKKKDDKKTRTAYVVYRTGELAQTAAHDYAERSVELDGHQLKIYKYRMPHYSPPSSYLKLRERRVVLKYLDKLTEKIDTCTAEEQDVPEWCTKRQKVCTLLIEKDDKFRESVGLLTPSLEDIRAMKGIKQIQGASRKSLLTRLGVLERPRPAYRRDSWDRDRDRDRSGGYDRRRSGGGGGGGGYRQPLKPSSRSILGCPPPSLLNMPTGVMPLSLMMQQNNLALMSGLMNQRAMNWAGMGDGGGMYRGGGGQSSEPSNKVLRLDSSGNLHPDYDGRGRRDDRSRSSYRGRNDRR